MSSNPLIVDRQYILGAEKGDQVFGEVYIERQASGVVHVEIACDTPELKFQMFVMMLYAARAIKQQENDLAWRVKLLSWEQILRSIEDEVKSDPPTPSTNDDIPF